MPDSLLPEVAFAGRSNVGKSSAINALLNRKKAARVSGTPGRTQAINVFECDGALSVADLPGYGFARVPDAVKRTWKGMIERYLSEREHLKLVVVLVDARHTAQEMDRMLLDSLADAGLHRLVLATKIDRVAKNKRKPGLAKLGANLGLAPKELMPFSSVNGTNVREAWSRIGRICGV
jgi:GTP-binding protein